MHLHWHFASELVCLFEASLAIIPIYQSLFHITKCSQTAQTALFFSKIKPDKLAFKTFKIHGVWTLALQQQGFAFQVQAHSAGWCANADPTGFGKPSGNLKYKQCCCCLKVFECFLTSVYFYVSIMVHLIICSTLSTSVLNPENTCAK